LKKALMSALGGGLSGAAGEFFFFFFSKKTQNVYFIVPSFLNDFSHGTPSSYPHGTIKFQS
jgi:hypothetical protein